MTTPRTEAGRALASYSGYLGTGKAPKAIRAIEDEAARKERERIADAVAELSTFVIPSGVYVDADAVFAAITDTGEGS